MVLVSDNGKITRFRLVAVVALVAIHSLAPPMYNWASESDKQQFSGTGGMFLWWACLPTDKMK